MIKGLLNNRLFWIFACLIVVGIAFLGKSVSDKNAMAKGVTDFNEMRESDFIEGRFVEGEVYELLDEFAYEEEYNQALGIKHNERVSSHYYVMPLYATYDDDVTKYAALCIGNTQLAAQAQQMIDEYWDYWETGKEPEYWTSIYVTGKVSKLDGELLDYFYEWFEYDSDMTRAEIDEMICPYIISYQVADAASSTMTVALVVMGIGVIGIIAVVIWLKKQGGGMQTDFGSFNGGSFGGDNFGSNSGGSQFPSSSNSFPTGGQGGYSSVNDPDRTEIVSDTSANTPQRNMPPANGGFEDMDSIDTSGLGVGIGDDD
ncbi:MAG: hypothetical protein NC078_02280 [Ruminococcus sp.]|nr:hypothetical protein [Ruminococcus sp.]